MIQRRTVVPATLLAALAVAVVVGLAPRARAQATAPATAPAVAPPVNQVSDLSTRYRFIERYAPAHSSGAAQTNEIGQYRVGSKDVMKIVSDTPNGAPDRRETTVQVIYTERAATVNSSGLPTALVRHFDTFQVTPQADAKPSMRKPLEGLGLWVQFKPMARPLVLALTPNHALTETEYMISTRLIFLPDLIGALSATPSRVGDRWVVQRAAAAALLGDRPIGQAEPLIGELADVRKLPDKPEMVADIRVTGNAKLPPYGSDTALNAQVLFQFLAPPAPAGGTDAANARAIVDARGAITSVRLARSSTSALPGTEGRLQRTLTWELILRRDLAQTGAPLAIPPSAPAVTEANSWVTYDDPKGRFHFRHPQDMRREQDFDPENDGVVQLRDDRAGSPDGRVVTLVLQPKTGVEQTDKDNRDPEFHKKDLNESWARNHRDVLRGNSGWLPDVLWSPYKMKVYRIEAAEKPSGAAYRDTKRIFLDHYLVLFGQNESLVLDSMTGQDPPTNFRKQVEEILKTFALGPSTKPPG